MGQILGHQQLEALFVGPALMATSVGITARVLRDLGVITSTEARIILGAAVIDDLLAMVMLAVVSGLASTGSINPRDVAVVLAQAVAFTVFLVFVGTRAMQRYALGMDRLHIEKAPFTVAMLLMLGLAALSASIGLAAIIGAFLAGIVLAEAREHFALEEQALPVYEFLVPFFFVIIGTQVDWRLFLEPSITAVALGVTALAVTGKLVGGALGVVSRGARSMAIVGVGMRRVARWAS
jgi:Kef-type K+ transport system membrane component KefB